MVVVVVVEEVVVVADSRNPAVVKCRRGLFVRGINGEQLDEGLLTHTYSASPCLRRCDERSIQEERVNFVRRSIVRRLAAAEMDEDNGCLPAEDKGYHLVEKQTTLVKAGSVTAFPSGSSTYLFGR